MCYFPFELTFLEALQGIHNSILNPLMVFITSLGNAGLIWILATVVLLFPKKTRPCGIAMGISLLLGLIFGNGILKNVIARTRPCWNTDGSYTLGGVPISALLQDSVVSLLGKLPTDYSWPSGHTLSSVECALVVFYHNRKPWGIVAIVLAVLIAFSRLYIGVHWPTDILGGALLGFATASAAIAITKLIFKKIAARKQANDVLEY